MSADRLVCYCLGITRDEIADEAKGKAPREIEGRIRALIKSGECTCETSNPSGKCCLADVRTVLVSERVGSSCSKLLLKDKNTVWAVRN